MNDRIKVIEGDITTLEVDAIVNAANTTLLGGGGVDGTIHRVAGPRLMEECRELNGCATGDAKITSGYDLPAKYVIHTVGPVWSGKDTHGEDALLATCYLRSLQIAEKNNIRTIAFPAISTGVYHFPVERATRIAVAVVKTFLEKHPSIEQVIFTCFNQEVFEMYKRVVAEMVKE